MKPFGWATYWTTASEIQTKCAHGVTVQDNPYGDTCRNIATEQEDFQFPTTADGTVIYFDSRTPTNHELATCPHITMSSSVEWNPHEIHFPSTVNHGEEGTYGISQVSIRHATFDMSTTCNFDERSISCVLTDRLLAAVNVGGEEPIAPDVPIPKTFATTKRHSAVVTNQALSERWFLRLVA